MTPFVRKHQVSAVNTVSAATISALYKVNISLIAPMTLSVVAIKFGLSRRVSYEGVGVLPILERWAPIPGIVTIAL